MKTIKTVKNTWIVLITVLVTWGCAPLQDQFTLKETQETKQATINLIEHSDTPFSENEDAVSALKTRIGNMVAYEKSKKNIITPNTIT